MNETLDIFTLDFLIDTYNERIDYLRQVEIDESQVEETFSQIYFYERLSKELEFYKEFSKRSIAKGIK